MRILVRIQKVALLANTAGGRGAVLADDLPARGGRKGSDTDIANICSHSVLYGGPGGDGVQFLLEFDRRHSTNIQWLNNRL